MIAQLRGRILRKSPQEAVLDVQGVGYRVAIPVSTFYKLPEAGADVSLRTFTHVREDALQLFGFATEAEEILFARLIEVSGVGPKLACNILSGIEAPELVEALRRSDVARLVRIPGVGKKTAERLALELKDKMPAVSVGADEESEPAPAHSLKDDLVSALANLGYSRPESEKGVARALESQPEGRFEDLLRRSLRVLSGR
ncbi:MAG TPA: Holliday junction branch migration protein RuvA [Vicinamibacteria bacterium]|nr:Holliday junction branch migration protein RuvA [Vicinamibacteria bacterium]